MVWRRLFRVETREDVDGGGICDTRGDLVREGMDQDVLVGEEDCTGGSVGIEMMGSCFINGVTGGT